MKYVVAHAAQSVVKYVVAHVANEVVKYVVQYAVSGFISKVVVVVDSRRAQTASRRQEHRRSTVYNVGIVGSSSRRRKHVKQY